MDWPVKVQWRWLMVRKGHRGSPSTGRWSFQSLSEENTYAWQPTAPAVRSKGRNSFSFRLFPILLLHVEGLNQGEEFGFSESSFPTYQPPPLLCPMCPGLQETRVPRAGTIPRRNRHYHMAMLYFSTAPLGNNTTKSSTGAKWGSPILTQLIGIIYKVLSMPEIKVYNKSKEIKLTKLCVYKERLNQLLKWKH